MLLAAREVAGGFDVIPHELKRKEQIVCEEVESACARVVHSDAAPLVLNSSTQICAPRSFKRAIFYTLLLLVFLFAPFADVDAQHVLFGDLKVDESKVEGMKPISFSILLYTEGGQLIGRQTVGNNGRYSFSNLRNGLYDVVVEVENSEVARVRAFVQSSFKTEFRQDIALEWRPLLGGKETGGKPNVISAADFYKRTPANKELFSKAGEALSKKKFEQALNLLRQIVTDDPKDYQAWTQAGTAQLALGNYEEAEGDYLRATEINPSFALAFLNLGRVRLTRRKAQAAIEPLTTALKLQPTSALANFYLGEAYLQIKKGSLAVGYLEQALKLDPQGMAEAHKRLAALYNAAGMKDKAAEEYKKFLAVRPDDPERAKLLEYIKENHKH